MVGKWKEIILVLIVFLVEGYVLLEDVFGVGKIMLVCVFFKFIDVDYKWI